MATSNAMATSTGIVDADAPAIHKNSIMMLYVDDDAVVRSRIVHYNSSETGAAACRYRRRHDAV
jgi:hypothetical protein